MSKKRAFGLMFIGISILSSLGNLTLTGNAIGSSYASYLSFLSIFSFVAGVVMVAVTKREDLEKKVEEIKDVKELRDLNSRKRRRLFFEIAHYLGRRPLTGEGNLFGAYGHRYMEVKRIINSPQIKSKIKRTKNEYMQEKIILEAIEKLINRGELNYMGPEKSTKNGSVTINLKAARKIIEAYEDYAHGDKAMRDAYQQFADNLRKIIRDYDSDEKKSKKKP